MSHEINQETLNELLDYNAETGDLIWRFRDISYFENSHRQKIWNAKYAGKSALNCTKLNSKPKASHRPSYTKHGHILGKWISKSRAIWIMHNGRLKKGEIVSFKDRDPLNNKIENLYITNQKETQLKQIIQLRRGYSDFKGVSFHKLSGKWQASLIDEYLGLFESKEAALEARKAAEFRLGLTNA